MADKSDTVLELDGVTKRYGSFVAVEELSFRVPRGIIYGILGPNGAGKTTTLRMINDILVPDEGRIRLFGDLAPGSRAARRIGYLPEERGLYPKMKVAETLAFFGELRGLSRKESAHRAGEWLARLGVEDWGGNRVQDLSKGMQQKVQFAASLIHDPELLILDEPWSGLDPINADVLKEIVVGQKEAGKSILFSTHLMEQAEQICDYVCIIAHGRKAVDGKLEEIKRESAAVGLVSVAFESEADGQRARDTVLADMSLVEQVTPRRDALQIQVADGRDPDELLRALAEAGLGIQRFERLRPSLHQIFVDRVGAQADARTANRRSHAQ
jgi:ABC-2 type transport system ATP-binding protein